MQAFSDCLWRGFLILYEKQENASVMWHLSSKEDVSSAMREATFTYKTTTILFKRTIISHFQVEDHKYPLKGPAYFQCCQCHADSTRTPNSFYYLFIMYDVAKHKNKQVKLKNQYPPIVTAIWKTSMIQAKFWFYILSTWRYVVDVYIEFKILSFTYLMNLLKTKS